MQICVECITSCQSERYMKLFDPETVIVLYFVRERLNCAYTDLKVCVGVCPQASFPNCLLHPGEEYQHVTRFNFTTG